MTVDAHCDLLQHALDYARRGWHVIPLHTPTGREDRPCSCHDPQCKDIGKHPRTQHGLKDATTDEAIIRLWWGMWPKANIGLATGPSGLVVIDGDPRHGGDDSWHDLQRQSKSDVDATLTSLSGGGGSHRFYQAPEGVEIRNSAGKLAAGIDVRAVGGYVVLPPSLHASGAFYEWDVEHHPDDCAPAPLPHCLLTRLHNGKQHTNGHTNGTAPPVEGQIREGTRDNTMASLAGSMRRRGHTGAEIEAALLVANRDRCSPPLPETRVSDIAHGIAQRYAPAENDAPGIEIRETDVGNAIRFATMHHGKAHFSLAHGWLVYDGKRWKQDPLQAVELGKQVVRAMHVDAVNTVDRKAGEELSKWAWKSESNQRIQAMLNLARSERGIRIDGEQLDQQQWLFNAGNGTVDLRTGELRRHHPADLITQYSPIPYTPTAPCTRFTQMLSEIMGNRQELVDYLQRWLGHCLTGSVQMQELLFLHGHGANGKNTLMEVIQLVMGDYATPAPKDLLMERKHEPHTQEIACLMGKRLVVADETDQGRRFNEALLKQLTGNSKLKGHFMRQNDIEFWPQFKIVLMANHRPTIRGTDNAIWRRLSLVPFDVQFHEPDAGKAPVKDTTLPAALREELPGILAWMVEGCRLWVADGYQLTRPEAVRVKSQSYRQEMDVLGDFLAERVLEKEGEEVQSSILHGVYTKWCANAHEPTLTQKAFSAAMEERGFKKGLGGPTKNRIVWFGLALIDTIHEEWDDDRRYR